MNTGGKTEMLKRLTALMAAVFFLLTAFTSIAYAEDFPDTNITTGTNSSTIVSDAETNYGILNENKAQLDAPQSYGLRYVAPPLELQVTVSYNGQSIPTSYGELAYGNPCGDYSDGHYRYLGYTYEGDYYTNIAYHPDAVPNGVDFETQQWIASPWQYNTIGAITVAISPWEGQQSYTDPKTGVTIPTNALIQAGMWYLNQTTGVGGINGEKGSGYTFDLGDGNPLWGNLYKYADIMMPPTETTWGMSRMFHTYNGYPYYVDIPLPPLALAELPFLDVEPTSATVSVGQTQWYHDYYFPAGGGQPVDVTTSSTWTSATPTIATIGAATGGATGVAPGTGGNVLTGTATLTVQQAQQPGGSKSPGGNKPAGQVSGILSFAALSQTGASRPAGTAEWTDMVTARLTSDAPPQPTTSSPNYITGWTWSISNATLDYPSQNPDFTFGYPIDPVAGAETPLSMATQNSSTAKASFREAWSMDGAGNGRGIYSIIKNPPGIMAATATPFSITASWTIKSNWTLMVYEGNNLLGGPIFSPESESQDYTGACAGTLKIDGSGVNSLGNNNNGN
jgi:hypothetical protein